MACASSRELSNVSGIAQFGEHHELNAHFARFINDPEGLGDIFILIANL